MPFELGIFFGAKRLGNKEQKTKNALVFERVKFSYQQYISDLNGIDTKAHSNHPGNIIRQTRNWLSTASKRTTIAGHIIITNEYNEFATLLPQIVALSGLAMDDIPFNDYCQIVEEAVKAKL